jgi:hypothetical protein
VVVRARGGVDDREEAENGLTLVEVVVAMMIMMLAIVTLAAIMTNAFAAVALSRQSQQATNLAGSVLAEDEALPWSTLAYGLLSTDATFVGDRGVVGNIVAGAGGFCFEGMPLVVDGSSTSACGGTSISWYNLPALASCMTSVGPNGAFPAETFGGVSYLAHQECVKMNGTNFEIGVYPTAVSGGIATTSQIRVTIEVSWGMATSDAGSTTHVSDSAVLSCGTTDGLSVIGCT